MGSIGDLLRASLARGNTARYELRTPGIDEDAWTFQGECCRMLEAVIPQVDDLEGQAPPVDPPMPAPPVEAWGTLVSGASGLAGRTKWLYGSKGVDIFVRRNTIVTAPRDCHITFQQVPGGPLLIGQMILQFSDGTAARYRHVSSQVGSQADAYAGKDVALVSDASMDMLHWPAGYPTPPDGYQHLDLSLASSVARLDPTGGAGGDVDADDYLMSHGGLPGMQWISHTPGPMDGMRLALMAAGRLDGMDKERASLLAEYAAWARWCGVAE